MQLEELVLILVEEVQANRAELLSHAARLASVDDAEAESGALESDAGFYAEFCGRASAAAESLGLAGLARLGTVLSDGLGMAAALPLELREPAGPLLRQWPDFFIEYLGSWRTGAPDPNSIATLLANVSLAEYLTPLSEPERADLAQSLLAAPSLQAQVAALMSAYTPLDAAAMSLEVADDGDPSALDGFLAEGPALVARLAGVVAGLVRGGQSSAQLELAHRAAHTVKGSAAIAGVRGVATLAHALEDLMEAFRRDDFVAPPGLHPAMMAGCDQLELALDELAQKGDAPEGFEHVCRQLHAWASRLQGIEVPDHEFDSDVFAELTEPPELEAQAALLVEPSTPAFADVPVAAQAVAPTVPDTVASAAQPAAEPREVAAEEDVQIRVPAKALDKLFRAVNELTVGLLRVRMQSADVLTRADAMVTLEQAASFRLQEIERRVTVQGMGRSTNDLRATGAPLSRHLGNPEFDSLELDRYNELSGAAQALNEAIGDLRTAREELSPALREVATTIQRQLDFAREAQYQVAQARLRPLSDLRSRLRRTVRQTCAAVGREAELEILGDDLRVDAAVLGPLSEALLHLLRNSVDHGIELPGVRLAAGKPREGQIKLKFVSIGGGVVATLTDDGRGLDHEAILDKALWSGLVQPDAKLTPEQIGRLIFLPGFSTRSTVTETSGRGVGLDAVAQAVASLQGNISVAAAAGGGTEFRLFVLASMGTVHALHVESDGEHFLVPSVQLERAEPGRSGVDMDLGVETPEIQHIDMAELMHGKSRAARDPESAFRPGLIFKVDGQLRRVNVDRIIEAREFLITPPPVMLNRMPGLSGVAALATGALALVLDLAELLRQPLPVEQQSLRELQASVPEQSHVLVVDDSTSVRNTLSTLLRDANYRVTTARDGLEAMQTLMEAPFSLVLTDLEMPQLNGFELTEFIRNRSMQRTVPVIMLTSRGQDKHRLRAAAAGVDVFLVKPYSDSELLAAMRSALTAAQSLEFA